MGPTEFLNVVFNIKGVGPDYWKGRLVDSYGNVVTNERKLGTKPGVSYIVVHDPKEAEIVAQAIRTMGTNSQAVLKILDRSNLASTSQSVSVNTANGLNNSSSSSGV